MQWTDGTHRTRSEKDGVSKTRGMTRHFSLLRSSRGKLKNETKPAPSSGRKVTLGRTGEDQREPVPRVGDVSNNTIDPGVGPGDEGLLHQSDASIIEDPHAVVLVG